MKKNHHSKSSAASTPSFGARHTPKGKRSHSKPVEKRKEGKTTAPAKKPARPHTSDARPKNKAVFQPKRAPMERRGVLLWGLHAVREAWLNPKRKCYRLWATDSALSSMQDTLDKARQKGLQRPEPLRSEKSEVEHFLPTGTVHQGVVLEVEPLPEQSLDDLLGKDDAADLVIILDQVTDPHNVGAVLRSAAAFGASAVIVTERNAPGTTGIMAKTACGAIEHVSLIPVVNIARTLEVLKDENFWCVGLAEEGGRDLSSCSLASGRIALVMGAEGDGLRRLTRERCDELVRLPTGGAIGSLNVSNASAIALYEVKRQRLHIND